MEMIDRGEGWILIISSRSFFFGDLGGEVVLEFSSAVVELVLHHQGGLVGHVQSHLVGEAGRLREEVEVSCSKAEGHWFVDVQCNFILISGLPLVEDCISGANLSSDGELDALLVGFNFDRFREASKLAANSVEFIGWHSADRTELSLRNSEVLWIQVHEGQIELWDLFSA